jgi:hypothetical protein
MAQKRTRKRSEPPPQREAVCPVGFCPVGMFLTTAGAARPEAVEHLMASAREFLLALNAVLGTRLDDLGRTSQIEKVELE